MKVLYGVWNYPQLSETYIRDEIAFVKESGVEVAVWSLVCRRPFETGVQVFRGELSAAIAAFKPDVFHVHYLPAARQFLPQVPLFLPMTVRGHSFDWNPQEALALAGIPNVHRIFVFPHFAAEAAHPKVIPLPAAVAARAPSEMLNPRKVLRTAAGRPDKGLADFFRASESCPGFEFTLAVAEAGGPGGGRAFVDSLWNDRAVDGGSVRLLVDVPWDEIETLVSESGIYMDTSDPKGHPFGMPVSIAQSMAAGAFVIARRSPAAEYYLGLAGVLYSNVEEAATIIRNHVPTAYLKAAALARASSFFCPSVLPPLVECWRSLARNTERREVSP